MSCFREVKKKKKKRNQKSVVPSPFVEAYSGLVPIYYDRNNKINTSIYLSIYLLMYDIDL